MKLQMNQGLKFLKDGFSIRQLLNKPRGLR
jgi:hypothetical protein